MTAARAALRARTRALHDDVDRRFGGFDLACPDNYARFLRAHAAAFLPVEAALETAGIVDLLPDWPARRRGERLRADLIAMDVPLPPALASPPRLGSEAALLGAAYVLEGSRLGGALLARQVAPGLPRDYLAAPQPPGGWRMLLEKLEATLYDEDRIAAATIAASAVFASFAAAAEEEGRRPLQ